MRLYICYGEYAYEGCRGPRAIFTTLEEAQSYPQWGDLFDAHHIEEWWNDGSGEFRISRAFSRAKDGEWETAMMCD